MSRKILITGGAGFVGSSLAIGLKKLYPHWQIICFDNLRRRGSELNLSRFKTWEIEFIHGDIRSSSDLDSTILNVDTIIDCSAEPSVLAGFASPQYVLQTNLVGTINLLELARQTQAKVLFLSTSRVYPIAALKSLKITESSTRLELASAQTISGVSLEGIAENFSLQGYRSLYGTTKLASELLIEEYRQAYKIPAIINRCGVLTGAWQMGKVDQGVFVLWVAAHYWQKPLKYIGYGGTGKQVRDLLHIEDLLRLIDYQLNNFELLDGEILNVGGGKENSLSLLETTQLCQKIVGKSTSIQPVAEAREGDIPIFITDITQIKQKTQWQPLINPEQTIKDIYVWIVENEQILQSVLF
jgi:CDP-paratose 2-epimerase